MNKFYRKPKPETMKKNREFYANAFKQEIFVSFLDRYSAVLTNDIPIKDGFSMPPDGPGWGTDIDEDVLKQFPPTEYTPVESEPYVEFF